MPSTSGATSPRSEVRRCPRPRSVSVITTSSGGWLAGIARAASGMSWSRLTLRRSSSRSMRSWPDEKADMNRHSLARTRSRNSRGAPRVGLFGLLGQGNLGNDGSLEAVLGYLRAAHPDAILDFMCGGPEEMTARYGIPAVRLRWHNAPPGKTPGALAFARAGMETTLGLVMDGFHTASWVRRHDVVIVPGMGVLEATLPLRAWHTPYSMFLLSATGRLFGTKVALVSVGADFMDQRAMRWLVTMAARLAHYRSYRDSFSRDA